MLLSPESSTKPPAKLSKAWWQTRGRSFVYAFAGLKVFFTTQAHAQFHLLASVVVISTAFVLQVSLADWRWLILLIGLVMAFEAMNTAIELLADAVHPDHHPLVGQAKDVAAAAVLMVSLVALILAVLIFLPYL